VFPKDPTMSPRRTQPPHFEPEPALLPIDPDVARLQARLAAATKDELVALVERLASSSEELAARIDYLTDPSAAAKPLQRRIGAIRSGRRFIAYADTRDVAAEMAAIVEDIRCDVLPRDAEKAAALAQKLFCLDQVIFDRADDSAGLIGDELRAACVLWLDAAAAVRSTNADRAPIGRRSCTSFTRPMTMGFVSRYWSRRIASCARTSCGPWQRPSSKMREGR
jgi:hypothetical protein